MNIKELTNKHKEIILNLKPEELISYLTIISKNKVGSLSFFSYNKENVIEDIETYNKYCNIEEDISNIFYNNENNKISAEFKKAVASGLTSQTDYIELLNKYNLQFMEARNIFFRKINSDLFKVYSDIKKDFTYLKHLLNIYYLTYSAYQKHNTTSLELSFNMLVEAVFNNLLESFELLEKYSNIAKTYEVKTEASEIVPDLEEVVSDFLYFYNECIKYKSELEVLINNPFEEGVKTKTEETISYIFEAPVNDLETFEEDLSEEEVKVFDALKEAVKLNTPKYDFNNFQLVKPVELQEV